MGRKKLKPTKGIRVDSIAYDQIKKFSKKMNISMAEASRRIRRLEFK